MKDEYVKLIAEIDKVLSMVRKMLMEAQNDTDKQKWKERLNESLTERFRLMGERDKNHW